MTIHFVEQILSLCSKDVDVFVFIVIFGQKFLHHFLNLTNTRSTEMPTRNETISMFLIFGVLFWYIT